MAIVQLKGPQSLGALSGSALGSGLSQGLQALVQSKVNQLQKQQQQQAWGSILGQQGANIFTQFTPEQQKFALQNPALIEELMMAGLSQQQQQQNPIEQALQQLQQQQPEQQFQLGSSPLGSLMQTPLGGSPAVALMGNQFTRQPISQSMQEQAIGQEVQQPSYQQQVAERARKIAEGAKPGLALQKERVELEKQKIAQKERQAEEARLARMDEKTFKAYKATEKDRSKALQDAEGADEDLFALKEMERLEDTGKLNSAGWEEFLTRSGLDIPALRSPESEYFKKIQQGFLKDAKKYFGGRVSNFEVEQFLKAIPSLSQSPEGRKLVTSNLKRLARMKKAYYNSMQESIKENDGVPPLDIADKARIRTKEKAEQIGNKFKSDITRLVGKSSKTGTALGAIAGEAVGRIPKAAAQAGAGYLAGSKFGPYGGAIGAGLGALSGLSGTSLLKNLF